MKSKCRILLIPYTLDTINFKNHRMEFLKEMGDVYFLPIKSNKHALLPPINESPKKEEIESIISEAEKNVDLIIGESISGLFWSIALRIYGYEAPIIIIPHNNPLDPRILLLSLLLKSIPNSNDKIIIGSNSSAKNYERIGISCDIIPTFGINLDIFNPGKLSKPAYKSRLGIKNNAKTIIFTGRMQRDKNVLEFAKMSLRLSKYEPELRIILTARSVRDIYEKAFLRLIHPIINSVIYFKGLPQTDLPILYRASDLFVSTATSKYETFGRSPLESMACGTVPVVSAFNGFHEHIPSSSGYLVPTLTKDGKPHPNVNGFVNIIREAFIEKTQLGMKRSYGLKWVKGYSQSAVEKKVFESLKKSINAETQSKYRLGNSSVREVIIKRVSDIVIPYKRDFLASPFQEGLLQSVLHPGNCINFRNKNWRKLELLFWSNLIT